MPQYVIEREIPGIGNLSDAEFQKIARKSVAVLKEMGPEIQWLHSYVTGDKIYCVYLAPDEETIREHARRGGFPANRVTAVRRMLDPSLGVNGISIRRLKGQARSADLVQRFSASSTACSTGIAQPSIHAVMPAALPSARRAKSRAFSSRGCSVGGSGAPKR